MRVVGELELDVALVEVDGDVDVVAAAVVAAAAATVAAYDCFAFEVTCTSAVLGLSTCAGRLADCTDFAEFLLTFDDLPSLTL